MSNTAFIELLEKLPFQKRKELFEYMEFLYQRSVKDDSDELTKDEIEELKLRREAYLANPETGIPMDEAKKKLLAKYGL